ncbi:hypothetical protein D9619_012202 [Psilocybe cf. subviscida]|uniref:Aspartate/glutamate/uridylate kinase domain-containing protein n=1 Tax=Psilocybe cf. subviscida TaxID=2480587 RepID=A0A8H5B7Q1_9AGAR|nr:hypothetical protein D9619_012202 [Psilocybe cf. subviscida]
MCLIEGDRGAPEMREQPVLTAYFRRSRPKSSDEHLFDGNDAELLLSYKSGHCRRYQTSVSPGEEQEKVNGVISPKRRTMTDPGVALSTHTNVLDTIDNWDAMTKEKKGIPSRTIVIKLGSSSIVHETTHQTLLSTLSAIVETVVHLKRDGHKVALVSSGAIAVGLKRMEMMKKPDSLSGKQALAAIGQGRLIALWDNLFGQLEQPIAQILLTRGDIADRVRYVNAVNTLKELLSMGVIPIVNENDTISVSVSTLPNRSSKPMLIEIQEIKFGDNDTLSAITASMIHADYLFLLTDVDGLYTSNPRKDPEARQIEVVDSVAEIRKQVSTTTFGSSLGTGGMETKLIAADIATAAGVTTVISSSKHPENIFRIIDYDLRARRQSSSLSASTSSNSSSGSPSTSTSTSATPRPPHTLFTAARVPMRDLKSWTAHTLNPSGSVIIDSGAYHVLSKRESGGRLLSAGVAGVVGAFAAGQAVRIVIRPFVGHKEREEERHAYLKALEMTRPSSPTTAAAAFDTEAEARGEADVDVEDARQAVQHAEKGEEKPHDVAVTGEPEEWEANFIEVGRGLANYNSAQIMAVKGLNSSMLPQILGYADSEYVVENVTIRLPFTSPPSFA